AAGASCAGPSWARVRSSWTSTCSENSSLQPFPGQQLVRERLVHVGRLVQQAVVDHPPAVVAPFHRVEVPEGLVPLLGEEDRNREPHAGTRRLGPQVLVG